MASISGTFVIVPGHCRRYTPPARVETGSVGGGAGDTGASLALLDAAPMAGAAPQASLHLQAPMAVTLAPRSSVTQYQQQEVIRPQARGPSGSATAVAARTERAVRRLDDKVRGRVLAAAAGSAAVDGQDPGYSHGQASGGGDDDGDVDSDWPMVQLASPSGDSRFVECAWPLCTFVDVQRELHVCSLEVGVCGTAEHCDGAPLPIRRHPRLFPNPLNLVGPAGHGPDIGMACTACDGCGAPWPPFACPYPRKCSTCEATRPRCSPCCSSPIPIVAAAATATVTQGTVQPTTASSVASAQALWWLRRLPVLPLQVCTGVAAGHRAVPAAQEAA